MNNAQLTPDKEIIVKLQGDAYDKAVNFVKTNSNHLTAEIDDFIITIACEPAEGMYVLEPEGGFAWQIPSPSDNQHIKVMIQDKYDHRFIPELQVYCRVHDYLDNFVEEKLQRFVWHPYLFHYGENWSLPEEGEYIIKLTIKTPKFARNDENLGNRYSSDVTLEFPPVHMSPARVDHS